MKCHHLAAELIHSMHPAILPFNAFYITHRKNGVLDRFH